MKRLAIVPIVEGHGEQQSAIRTLLTRLWNTLGGEHVDVLPPIRRPRGKLVVETELLKAIDLAELKLRQRQASNEYRAVLILIDADEDLPCVLGPQLQQIASRERSHIDVFVVIANVEYETWFVAAAESLAAYFDLHATVIARDPEAARQAKATVKKLTHGRYAETVDQPRLTAAMDLRTCRERSKSFDKLCRELEKRLAA
jgi:uncharacterized protein DUF4276